MGRLPHPLSAFLGSMEQESEFHSFPMLEAQREKLDELVRISRLDRRFERGDEVHVVAGQGPFKREAVTGVAMLFWRYLTGSSEDDDRRSKVNDAELSSLPDLDCLLAYYDGENVKFQIYCSYMLQPGPWPKED